jgi:hypothetical protein
MKERFMKDFNGEKIFSLEYDKETLRDMLLLKPFTYRIILMRIL